MVYAQDRIICILQNGHSIFKKIRCKPENYIVFLSLYHHFTQALDCYVKKEWRHTVPLCDPLKTFEIWPDGIVQLNTDCAIHQDTFNPLTQSGTEPSQLETFQQKVPVHLIISLLEIELNNNAHPFFDGGMMQNLMQRHHSIHDTSMFNKCILVSTKQFVIKGGHPVIKHLSDRFVGTSEQADWPKLLDPIGPINF